MVNRHATGAAVALLLLTLALAVGCRGEKEDGPEVVFTALQTAAKAEDFDAIYDLFSLETQGFLATTKSDLVARCQESPLYTPLVLEQLHIETLDRLTTMSMKEYFAVLARKAAQEEGDLLAHAARLELLDTQLSNDGQRAELTVKTHTGDTIQTHVIRENNTWKLDFADLFRQ